MLIKYNDDEGYENRLLKLFEYLSNSKDIIQIENLIFHILLYKWKPIPPSAKPLRWYENLNEIRVKIWNNLYRINYFVDLKNNYMVLLNWYTKPDWKNNSNNYNKSKKKKIDKIIEESIKEAELLQKNYYLNIWNYDFYN